MVSISHVIFAGLFSIVIAIIIVRLYIGYQKDQLRKEFQEKKEKLLKIYSAFKNKDRYIIKYNTSLTKDTRIQKTCVVDLPGEVSKAASLKRELSKQIQKEFSLNDCQIVRITHVNEYVDFLYTIETKQDQDDDDDGLQLYGDSRKGLVAA